MPPLYTIQPTFTGGEIAPGLQGRVDIAKYSTGLDLCKNAIIHPQGGVSNRAGFKYIASPKYDNKKCRLVPFEYSEDQAYIIEVGDGYARFFYQSGQILVDDTAVNDFDPSVAHSKYEITKYGDFIGIPFSTPVAGLLFFSAPYGDVNSSVVKIAGETNTSDNLAVTWDGGTNTATIKFADTTPAKNSANLIQAAFRAANAILSGWFVTENPSYAAARPTTGVIWAAQGVSAGGAALCVSDISSSATNTSYFPYAAQSSSYWHDMDGLIYEIRLPYAEADIAQLKFAQSVDVLYITHPDYKPRTITRRGHTDWRLAEYEFSNGPFMPYNATATTLTSSNKDVGSSTTLTASASLFTSDHVDALFEIIHDLPSQTQSGSFSGNASSTSILGMGAWRLITHGTWTGKITVEKSTDGGSNWVEVRAFSSSNDFNPNTFGTDDNDGEAAYYRVTMSNYSSGTCNYDLTIDAGTVHGIAKVTVVTNATTATATILRQIGKTTATQDWAEGSWSTERGWPAVVAFFQDRICFGRTPAEPQTIWMSVTGDYTNFGTSDPIVDDDAISISLPSRKMNGIESIVPLGEMLVLTRSGEWSVGAGSGEPITPSTVSVKSHGFRGTNGVEPSVIGNRAIYAQPQGKVIRDIGFDFSSDGYTGDDISLISSHLFQSSEIVDLCYQQEPDSLIWALRADGVLLSGTYVREQQVLCWSQHVTDGEFESIATIPGTGYDQLWVVVKRDTERFIELQAQRMQSEEPEDQFFVDCGITYDGAPATTITGLDHLEGRTVSVLADGIDIPDQVVSGGEITLDVEASVVHVGIAYTTDIRTLKIESTGDGGTLQSRRSRCSHVNTKFLKSRGGKIGPDEDHLYEINSQLHQLVDLEDPLALCSGDVMTNIGADWDNGGQIMYRQDRPLPVTILAFMPIVTVGG